MNAMNFFYAIMTAGMVLLVSLVVVYWDGIDGGSISFWASYFLTNFVIVWGMLEFTDWIIRRQR